MKPRKGAGREAPGGTADPKHTRKATGNGRAERKITKKQAQPRRPTRHPPQGGPESARKGTEWRSGRPGRDPGRNGEGSRGRRGSNEQSALLESTRCSRSRDAEPRSGKEGRPATQPEAGQAHHHTRSGHEHRKIEEPARVGSLERPQARLRIQSRFHPSFLK